MLTRTQLRDGNNQSPESETANLQTERVHTLGKFSRLTLNHKKNNTHVSYMLAHMQAYIVAYIIYIYIYATYMVAYMVQKQMYHMWYHICAIYATNYGRVISPNQV